MRCRRCRAGPRRLFDPAAAGHTRPAPGSAAGRARRAARRRMAAGRMVAALPRSPTGCARAQGARDRALAGGGAPAFRRRDPLDRRGARGRRRVDRVQRPGAAPAPQRARPDPVAVPRFHLVRPGRPQPAVPLRFRLLGQAARRRRSRGRCRACGRSRAQRGCPAAGQRGRGHLFRLAGRPGEARPGRRRGGRAGAQPRNHRPARHARHRGTRCAAAGRGAGRGGARTGGRLCRQRADPPRRTGGAARRRAAGSADTRGDAAARGRRRIAGRCRHRSARAPAGHRREPLARGGRDAPRRPGARGVLSGYQPRRDGRAVVDRPGSPADGGQPGRRHRAGTAPAAVQPWWPARSLRRIAGAIAGRRGRIRLERGRRGTRCRIAGARAAADPGARTRARAAARHGARAARHGRRARAARHRRCARPLCGPGAAVAATRRASDVAGAGGVHRDRVDQGARWRLPRSGHRRGTGRRRAILWPDGTATAVPPAH